MSLPQIIGLITGALTIVGTVVAVAVYMTKLQAQVQQGKLEVSLTNMQEKLEAMEAKYSDLRARHQETLVAGSYLAGKKQAIDIELANLTDALEANSSSILVPVPSDNVNEGSNELVFLTLLGEGSEKLKGIRVPLDGDNIAANVYKSRKPRVIHAPRDESDVSAKTDELSKTITNEMLALPLIYKGRCVGVVEFLNKTKRRRFDEKDQARAERAIGSISTNVGDFIQDPNSFPMLGITPKRSAQEATILFSDLSRSSLLIEQLDTSVVMDFLNEYFEALCTIALAHGGRIDKFIGDGFMMTFNVKHPVTDPEYKASLAALEMQKEFDEVKKRWSIFTRNIPEIYNRIGIESGPVHNVEVGHSQVRQLTVMGEAVNAASNLCQVGNRSRNIIIVGTAVHEKISERLATNELASQDLVGVKDGIPKAYELVSQNQ